MAEERTTLTIIMTREEKRKLKIMAAEKETTVKELLLSAIDLGEPIDYTINPRINP
jgi:hypothetical protein